jgi:hypothetical protein
MTTPFNSFGVEQAAVLGKFALGGYVPTAEDFGGTTAIDDAIFDAVNAIVQAMPVTVRNALQLPWLMKIEARAAAGQTTARIPLVPLVAGKIHVWQGNPQMFTTEPVLATNPWRNNSIGFNGQAVMQATPTPPAAQWELADDKFSVDLATGVVTLVDALSRNDQVYASAEVAIDDEDYVLPSMADLVASGAAAMLGYKVYSQASQQWEYVTRLGSAFGDTIKGLQAGEWVPTELRTMQWWKAPEPDAAANRMGSIKKFRA